MTTNIHIRRIHKDAVMPNRAHDDDAGLDLYAVEGKHIQPGESALISTGIQLQLPAGTEAQIRPRSGLALKHAVTVLNSPGTIDAGYRGELKVILINHGKRSFHVTKQMRVAQMVIAPILSVTLQESDEISASDRDTGGFGSSGV